MTLFRMVCIIIGTLLCIGCGFSIIAMFYAAYTASIQTVIWLVLAVLSGMVGLMLIYYGSDGG